MEVIADLLLIKKNRVTMGTKDTSSTLLLGLSKSSDSTCMYYFVSMFREKAMAALRPRFLVKCVFKPRLQEISIFRSQGLVRWFFSVRVSKSTAVIPVSSCGHYVASPRRVRRSFKGTLTMAQLCYPKPWQKQGCIYWHETRLGGPWWCGSLQHPVIARAWRVPQIVMHHDTPPFFDADVLRLCHSALQRSCLPM